MAQNSLKKCFNLLEYIAAILFIMLSIFIVFTVFFISISISRTLSVIPIGSTAFTNPEKTNTNAKTKRKALIPMLITLWADDFCIYSPKSIFINPNTE